MYTYIHVVCNMSIKYIYYIYNICIYVYIYIYMYIYMYVYVVKKTDNVHPVITNPHVVSW